MSRLLSFYWILAPFFCSHTLFSSTAVSLTLLCFLFSFSPQIYSFPLPLLLYSLSPVFISLSLSISHFRSLKSINNNLCMAAQKAFPLHNVTRHIRNSLTPSQLIGWWVGDITKEGIGCLEAEIVLDRWDSLTVRI